jgi:hypothetical protein
MVCRFGAKPLGVCVERRGIVAVGAQRSGRQAREARAGMVSGCNLRAGAGVYI